MRTSSQPHDREAVFWSRYIPLRNQSGLIRSVANSRWLAWGRPLFPWTFLLREQADLVVHLLESQDDGLQGPRGSLNSLMHLVRTALRPRGRFGHRG